MMQGRDNSGPRLNWDDVQDLAGSDTEMIAYQGGALVLANERFRTGFGFEGLDLPAIEARLWSAPGERERFQERLRVAATGCKEENADHLLLDGAGQEVKARVQFAWMTLADDEPVCVCMVLRNAPPPRLQEFYREYGEDVFRIIADNSLNAIILANDRLEVVYANPATLELFGFASLEEAQRTPVASTIAPESMKVVAERARNWMEGRPNPPKFVFKIVRRDGELRTVEVLTHDNIFLRGRRCHLQSMIDITDRLQAQEARAEAERKLVQARADRTPGRPIFPPPEGRPAEECPYPSPAIRAIYEEARIGAASDSTILLLGPSGVGKSFLAGWIHERSRRATGPFFDLNCTALTPSLIESELFGHEAGAFTGTVGRKRGLLEMADGGTLFLDEIGDLDYSLQAKLLNFLDTFKLRRVGGQESIDVDARIITATNRKLDELVAAGRFREDLYYRLSVLTLQMPALKDRREDIPALARELLVKLCREMGREAPPDLSPKLMAALEDHPWPGNVRELRNVLERLLLRARDQAVIDDPALPRAVGLGAGASPPPAQRPRPGAAVEFNLAVHDFKRGLVEQALREGKTKKEAAELLGLSRHALDRYVRSLKLGPGKTGPDGGEGGSDH
jgi:PAS domain S-box-containing protein